MPQLICSQKPRIPRAYLGAATLWGYTRAYLGAATLWGYTRAYYKVLTKSVETFNTCTYRQKFPHFL